MKARAHTHWPMVAGASGVKARDRRESSRRQLEEDALNLPFSFLSSGESLTLYQHRPDEARSVAMFTLYDGIIFRYGTTEAVASLYVDGVTVYPLIADFPIYRAEGNYLHPSNSNHPTLYFDDQGRRQQQRGAYEQKKKQREKEQRQREELEARVRQRSQAQQQEIQQLLQKLQTDSSPRPSIFRRLAAILGVLK